jgi:hypothetical protein
MHYLDVRKKRSQNEFEEDIDRELIIMKGKNGILLFVFNLKGLLEE